MILIVDDLEDNCVLLARMLEHGGHASTSVHSAEAALISIEASRPSVVVLDDYMPGMTGLELLTQLRSDERYMDLPVVFYTAGTDLARRDLAMSLCAEDWIVKGTLPLQELIARIAVHLPRGRLGRKLAG